MADNMGGSVESDGHHNCAGSASGDGGIKEQDRLLPIANVGRIMKQILPPNAKISKEAKETMQECVSEFISFVTGEASDKCHKEKRKTVNGDDICWALNTLGFDDYVEPMRRYLLKYREMEGDRAATGGHSNKATGSDAGDQDAVGEQRRNQPSPSAHLMFNAMETSHNPSASRGF
ncbi:nuclear transcription factor Y subunit B-1-like [Musa acuminata AAA Group]|uniref:nuclear transcription factor Y subunit B-1-like n=1 Tax=Musa acuminata AAA Group TaxID=214697 RepID=UPI0031DB89BC